MWLANLVCVGMIQVWAKAGVMTLGKIWWALAVSEIVMLHFLSDLCLHFESLTCIYSFSLATKAFMGTQVVTGIIRFQSKTGVWKILQAENSKSR